MHIPTTIVKVSLSPPPRCPLDYSRETVGRYIYIRQALYTGRYGVYVMCLCTAVCNIFGCIMCSVVSYACKLHVLALRL